MNKSKRNILCIGLATLLAGALPTWAQDSGETPPTPVQMDEHTDHVMPEADEHAGHVMPEMDEHAGHVMPDTDEHAAHRAAMEQKRYSVIEESYAVPEVELIDQSGNAVALRKLLEGDQPVALNFIFTTCTTICPVMTATFAQMRRELGEASDRIQLVSITIDPEYDRPEVLNKYAELFHAGEGWTFLTGDSDDILLVLQSFKSYAGSKMNHRAVTLLKNPHSNVWTRIDGLASGKDLAHEVAARLLN
jgi:protein SCO1/2